MNNKQYFSSQDLTFTAAAILTGKVSIAKVTWHPQKNYLKVYWLTPENIAKEIHLQYVSDQLKMSPIQLSAKIAAIKNLQAEVEN